MKFVALPVSPDMTDGGRFRPFPVKPEIVLDLSRLVSRLLHPTPTGVDRVEMAYARELLVQAPERLSFSGVHPGGVYGRLDRDNVLQFLDQSASLWEMTGGHETMRERYARAARWLWRLRPRPIPTKTRPRILLQPSHNGLDKPGLIAAKKTKEQARLVCLVHDLIPITHPEYARPGGAATHQRRMMTVEREADAVVVNSQATRSALVAHSGPALQDRPILVAPLGIDDPGTSTAASPTPERPYFICLGTIEPRKNHLLLLNIWRAIVTQYGAENAPMLLIAGRRGWENENVIDMLERCAELRGVVRELDRVPDTELRPLVADARALLMPSFAEGFGLPVAEALAAGTPVIASDLPAHREVGGAVPDYLDPLDGPAWRDAILAYASDTSLPRHAQLRRMAQWSPTRWDSHIRDVLALAERLARC